MLDEVALWRTDREDGTRRLGDNLFGNRATKCARESIAATRDDRNQIDLVFKRNARGLGCAAQRPGARPRGVVRAGPGTISMLGSSG